MDRLSIEQQQLVERLFALPKVFINVEVSSEGFDRLIPRLRLCDYDSGFAFWLSAKQLCHEGRSHGFVLSEIAIYPDCRLAYVSIVTAPDSAPRLEGWPERRRSLGASNALAAAFEPRQILIEG